MKEGSDQDDEDEGNAEDGCGITIQRTIEVNVHKRELNIRSDPNEEEGSVDEVAMSLPVGTPDSKRFEGCFCPRQQRASGLDPSSSIGYDNTAGGNGKS